MSKHVVLLGKPKCKGGWCLHVWFCWVMCRLPCLFAGVFGSMSMATHTHTKNHAHAAAFVSQPLATNLWFCFFQEISFEKGAGVSLEKGCSRTPLKKGC